MFDVTLKSIMQKIDTALISDTDKEKLYESVLTAIQQTVWPIVIKHMPEDAVKQAVGNPDTLTVDTYVDLVDRAMSDGTASDEIEPALNALIITVDKMLKEKNIV
jgi:hypothetical protein